MPEIISGTSTFRKHETTLASLERYNVTDLNNALLSDDTKVKCYPNPFGYEISIELYVPESTGLTIDILAQDGRLIKQIARNMQISQGIQLFKWDGTNNQKSIVSAGIYHMRIRTDKNELHQKIVFKR